MTQVFEIPINEIANDKFKLIQMFEDGNRLHIVEDVVIDLINKMVSKSGLHVDKYDKIDMWIEQRQKHVSVRVNLIEYTYIEKLEYFLAR